MKYNHPEYRESTRLGYCRACDKEIKIGEKMVIFHSFRNSGMSVIICKDCVSIIYNLTLEDKKNAPDIQADI